MELTIAIIIGVFGLTAALLYVVLRSRVTTPLAFGQAVETAASFRRRLRRRDVGAALTGLLAIAFPAGLMVGPRIGGPMFAAVYWLVFLAGLAVLCLLAIGDLRHTRRLRHDLFRPTAEHATSGESLVTISGQSAADTIREP